MKLTPDKPGVADPASPKKPGGKKSRKAEKAAAAKAGIEATKTHRANIAKHPVSPTPSEKASGSFQAQNEQEWVEAVKEEIKRRYIGDLELDILGDKKEQSMEALGKFTILKKSILLMDSVTNQEVDIKTFKPEDVAAAIGEFMTYQK